MAATRLIPLHVNKGKKIAQSLGDRTDYASNPKKTEKGELVSGYMCDPMTVDEEFLLSKRQYQQITGRESRHDVIAYQIRQSFKPEDHAGRRECIGAGTRTSFYQRKIRIHRRHAHGPGAYS